MAANNIARWDGQAWHPLGSGLAGPVNALAVDGDGNLYAGGGEINRWDGRSWHHLAEVAGGAVYALALDGAGNLYAGGDFTAVEGMSAKYAARYDGTSWTPLGVGTNGLDCYSIFEPCLGVRALLLDALGNVYAGGDFNRPDLHDIAYWDGEHGGPSARRTWTYYSMGIFALARDGAGNLYAAGDNTPIGGRIARWNGVSWQAMGSGLSSTAAQDTCYRYDLRTVSALAADTEATCTREGGSISPVAGYRPTLRAGQLPMGRAAWVSDPTHTILRTCQ